MRKIRGIYLESARKLASILTSGELDDKSKITQDAARQMQEEFERAAKAISKSIVDEVPRLITRGANGYSTIEVQFLTEALEGIDQGLVTTKGLQNIYLGINTRLVDMTLHRIGQDGYTFTQRAARTAARYQPAMENLIAAGFAQGRDLAKIASDLTKYVVDGLDEVIAPKRWGEILKPGTKEFLKRVPSHIDYRALRIARSELSMSLQEVARQNGHVNPGATDWYDWVRINLLDHGCACPELQANSPYQYAYVPAYPHPNCLPGRTLVLGGHGQRAGKWRRIDSFRVGDMVLTNKANIKTVTKIMRQRFFGRAVEIRTAVGSVKSTPNHPFWVNDEWIDADKIRVGDKIRYFGQSGFFPAEVAAVKRPWFWGWVYNLTVEDDKSYFANGFASHNCECQVRPRLRDGREFRDELRRWATGESVPSLSKWMNEVYRPAQIGA